jgi:hypothetical protein
MSHRDLLADDSVDGWYPRSAPYWQLYERFKQETWADELAWAASQRTRPTDECYSHCVLQVHLIDGPLQYWVRRPQGTRVNQALARAVDLAAYAASMACYDRRAPSQSQSPVPADLLRRIRASLSDVTASGKQQLLSHLADAEKRCGGRG